MDYGMGTAAPDGGETTTNDDRREQPGAGGDTESGACPPQGSGSALTGRTPRYLSERDVARRRAEERQSGWDLIDGHTSTCRTLGVNCADVSPADLRRAALSDDPRVQVSRLTALFKACAIVGLADEVERADVVRVAAEQAPQGEGERQTLFHLIAADRIAMRSAGEAASGRHTPQVAAIYTGDFVKASKLHAGLQDRLQAMRHAASPPPTEIRGHVHLHAGGPPPLLAGGGGAVSLAVARPARTPDVRDAEQTP